MANKIDEYNKQLSNLNGNPNADGNAQPQGGGSNADNYYELARQQEYGTLYDKEVQLENAKQNALKYTQNQINAQGFGGTGYGSSMQSGIYNNYLNKVGEAKTEYNDNIREINAQENEANANQANDHFQSLTTMLAQADSVDTMNSLLGDYGYIEKDENGNIVFDANGNVKWVRPDGMSDDDWYQMKYYYGLQKNAFDDEARAKSMQNAEFTLNDATIMYSDENGNNYRTMNNGDDLTQELNATKMGIATGQIPSGSYIHLESKQGKHIFMKYENGKLYYIKKSDYTGANTANCFYCYGRNEMQNTKK